MSRNWDCIWDEFAASLANTQPAIIYFYLHYLQLLHKYGQLFHSEYNTIQITECWKGLLMWEPNTSSIPGSILALVGTELMKKTNNISMLSLALLNIVPKTKGFVDRNIRGFWASEEKMSATHLLDDFALWYKLSRNPGAKCSMRAMIHEYLFGLHLQLFQCSCEST